MCGACCAVPCRAVQCHSSRVCAALPCPPASLPAPLPTCRVPSLLLIRPSAHALPHSFRSIGKILRLRQKITSIKDSVTGLFSGSASKDASSQKLDAFKGELRAGRLAGQGCRCGCGGALLLVTGRLASGCS